MLCLQILIPSKTKRLHTTVSAVSAHELATSFFKIQHSAIFFSIIIAWEMLWRQLGWDTFTTV